MRPKNRGIRCDRGGYCDWRRDFKGAPRTCVYRDSLCYKLMVEDRRREALTEQGGE